MATSKRNRIDERLDALEASSNEASAMGNLYDFLSFSKTLPITFAQRTRAGTVTAALSRKGYLRTDHQLFKLLTHRLAHHFLPGVSELNLPAVYLPQVQEKQTLIRTESQSSSISMVGGGGGGGLKQATSGSRSPLSDEGGAAGTGSGGGRIEGIDQETVANFLFQPLSKGTKMMCIISRYQSKFKQSVYKMYIEQFAIDDEKYDQVREELDARRAPIDRKWAIPWDEGGKDVPSSTIPVSSITSDPSRLLIEVRKNKSTVSKSGQINCYTVVKGQKGQLLGCIHSPSSGIMTGSPPPPPSSSSSSAASAPAKEVLQIHPLGSRICVQTSEKDRLLSLSVALPAPPPTDGQAQETNFDLSKPPERLQVPLAHLNTLCSDCRSLMLQGDQSSSSIICLLNKPPKYNSLHGLHTIEFEGPGRVTEASRKNIALLDARHLLPVTEVVDRGSGSGGKGGLLKEVPRIGGRGGGGGGVSVEDWSLEKSPRPLLQLGKVGEGRFSLDFRPPFSPFQALVVAIAAFET